MRGSMLRMASGRAARPVRCSWYRAPQQLGPVALVLLAVPLRAVLPPLGGLLPPGARLPVASQPVPEPRLPQLLESAPPLLRLQAVPLQQQVRRPSD